MLCVWTFNYLFKTWFVAQCRETDLNWLSCYIVKRYVWFLGDLIFSLYPGWWCKTIELHSLRKVRRSGWHDRRIHWDRLKGIVWPPWSVRVRIYFLYHFYQFWTSALKSFLASDMISGLGWYHPSQRVLMDCFNVLSFSVLIIKFFLAILHDIQSWIWRWVILIACFKWRSTIPAPTIITLIELFIWILHWLRVTVLTEVLFIQVPINFLE